MTHHNHEHEGSGGHAHGHHEAPGGWRPHKDWRVWVAVVLMLGGMVAYILSMDESIRPSGGAGPGQAVTTTVPARR